MNKRQEKKQECITFIKINLKECIIELIDFHKTGVLIEKGKIENLSEMCKEWGDPFYSLKYAQDLIIKIALEKIVKLLP